MHTYTHASVVNNCLIYCAGCILQAHSRSRPAWAHHFHGLPNEIRILLGSDALPWNTFFPRELWSFLHLLQWDLSADGITIAVDCKPGKMLFPVSSPTCSCRAPPSRPCMVASLLSPARPHSHLELVFSKTVFSFLHCLVIWFAGGGSWPGALLGVIRFTFMHLHFLQSECELMGIFHKRTPAYARILSSRMLSSNTQGRPWCSRVLAWGSFCFFHLNKFILLLTRAVSFFALKKEVCTPSVQSTQTLIGKSSYSSGLKQILKVVVFWWLWRVMLKSEAYVCLSYRI